MFCKKHKTQNVIGMKKGTAVPDSFIVFSAHYDHLGKMGKATYFPGANEYASGISMLLNLAKHYSKHPQKILTIGCYCICGRKSRISRFRVFVKHPMIPLKQIKFLLNEIGLDVKDFEIGMKHAVREDPDVMLVGEMRDRETFMTAIHAAETGHLVFGTIHASSAATTIGRILDLFPADMHSALRSALAFNMKGIVAQKLLPSIKPGVSRVPTVEIMTFNSTVRKLILEEKDEKLPDAIRMCAGKDAGFHDEPEGPGESTI